LEFFANFINSEKKSFAKSIFIIIILLFLITVLIAFATSFFKANYDDFDLLWGIFVIGVVGVVGVVVGGGEVVIGVVGKRRVGGGEVEGVVVGGGIGVTFIFIILLIKIFFTLKNIFYSFNQIPYNWSRLTIYQDMCSQAEIIPGINKFNGLKIFRFSYLKSKVINSDKVSSILLLLIFYISTLAYRISLKSTSLFYWTLFIYPTQNNENHNNKEIKETILKEQKIYFWFPIFMISLFLSININFGEFNIIFKSIEEASFYPHIKYFLSYFVVSAVLYELIWIIAFMFLVGNENNSGFYRVVINALHILLKLSISIAIMLYLYYLYNYFNILDVIQDIYKYYKSISLISKV
jgi:hypothetical protein